MVLLIKDICIHRLQYSRLKSVHFTREIKRKEKSLSRQSSVYIKAIFFFLLQIKLKHRTLLHLILKQSFFTTIFVNNSGDLIN